MDATARKLLDPDAIARAEALGMEARLIVEGYMAGEHKSPFHGFAIEFAQHREYVPGDDVRHLDWKVLGRTERHYVKQYEQETNFVAHLLLDGSASMQYGSGDVTKIEYGRRLAACLAYLVLRQRDALALAIFDEGIRTWLPRSNNRDTLFELTARLAGFEPTGATRIAEVLHQVATQVRRKGIIVVISDFFDDEASVLEGIRHLRFAGHEVIVIQVLDPWEVEFPFGGLVEFEGLEGGERVRTRPSEVRRRYLAEFEAFRGRLREACERSECHLVSVRTDQPLDEVLAGYLAFRRAVVAS